MTGLVDVVRTQGQRLGCGSPTSGQTHEETQNPPHRLLPRVHGYDVQDGIDQAAVLTNHRVELIDGVGSRRGIPPCHARAELDQERARSALLLLKSHPSPRRDDLVHAPVGASGVLGTARA